MFKHSLTEEESEGALRSAPLPHGHQLKSRCDADKVGQDHRLQMLSPFWVVAHIIIVPLMTEEHVLISPQRSLQRRFEHNICYVLFLGARLSPSQNLVECATDWNASQLFKWSLLRIKAFRLSMRETKVVGWLIPEGEGKDWVANSFSVLGEGGHVRMADREYEWCSRCRIQKIRKGEHIERDILIVVVRSMTIQAPCEKVVTSLAINAHIAKCIC